MDENTLREWLKQADEAVPMPAPAEVQALAALVRQRARRARHVRQALAFAAAAVLVAGIGLGVCLRVWQGSPAPQQHPAQVAQAEPGSGPPELPATQPPDEQIAEPADLAETVQLTRAEMMQLRSEIADLRDEAALRQQIIDTMLVREAQQQRLAVLEKQLAAYRDPVMEARGQREETAARSLYWAQARSQQDGLTASAQQDYRRIIELFPETQAAAKARQRLGQPNQNTKGEIL